MPPTASTPFPHLTQPRHSIRKIYIQSLTDLLHVCLLRGELERARRAWAILIRCREVDWRSKWQWGLFLLEKSHEDSQSLAIDSTQLSTFRSQDGTGREAERWLKSLRVSAKEVDKPALLHALILHLIKYGRYRAALEELETYLSSYPYLKSGPLHTYAGLLSFYLAQPPSSREEPAPLDTRSQITIREGQDHDRDESPDRLTEVTSSPSVSVMSRAQGPVNASMIRAARVWFAKAAELDENDRVAVDFLQLIDQPQLSDDDSDGDERDRKTNEEYPDEDENSNIDAVSEAESDGHFDESDTCSF